MGKIALTLMFMFVGSVGFCLDASFVIPNLEATGFYDFETKEPVIGATSKFAYIGDFDCRLGGYTNTTTLGISYDLRKLDNLGLKVGYAWGSDWQLSIGAGLGVNFNTNKISANLLSVLLQIGLK